MAEGKEGFILYKNIIHTVKKLPKDMQADLFMIILQYVNDENPVVENFTLEVAFEPIKQSLKKDLKKYEKICERNKVNGSKGGRPKKPKKPSGLSGNPKNPNEPKKADIDIDIDIEEKIYKKEPSKNLEERKKEFKKSLVEHQSEKYDVNLLKDFFIYWTEHGDKDKKMRFEREKTFGTAARLHTWWKNREARKQQKERI